MACPNTSRCPLFPLFRMKSSLNVWKVHYCDAAFENCERLRLSTGGACVPPNLLPNGKELSVPAAG